MGPGGGAATHNPAHRRQPRRPRHLMMMAILAAVTNIKVLEKGWRNIPGCLFDSFCIERGTAIDGFGHRNGPKSWQKQPPIFWGWFCQRLGKFRCPTPSILDLFRCRSHRMSTPLMLHPVFPTSYKFGGDSGTDPGRPRGHIDLPAGGA